LRAVRLGRSVLGVRHRVIEKAELEQQGGEGMLVAWCGLGEEGVTSLLHVHDEGCLAPNRRSNNR
jgi:hypothetical protein